MKRGVGGKRLKTLRDIWVYPAIAVAALVAGYGCVAAARFLSQSSDDVAGPSFVQPLPLIKSPEPRRFAAGDRGHIASAVQAELLRVGCYSGAKNGVWTPATRNAMDAFVKSVNAQLPTDAPDEALLSLVESHRGDGCREPSEAMSAPMRDAVLIAAPAAPYRQAVDGPATSAAAMPEQSPVARPVPMTAEPITAPPAAAPAPTALANVELLDTDPAAGRRDDRYTPEAGAAAAALAVSPSDASPKTRKRSAKKLRPYKSKPPKFVKSFIRSVNKTLGSLGF